MDSWLASSFKPLHRRLLIIPLASPRVGAALIASVFPWELKSHEGEPPPIPERSTPPPLTY